MRITRTAAVSRLTAWRNRVFTATAVGALAVGAFTAVGPASAAQAGANIVPWVYTNCAAGYSCYYSQAGGNGSKFTAPYSGYCRSAVGYAGSVTNRGGNQVEVYDSWNNLIAWVSPGYSVQSFTGVTANWYCSY
ncbi:peptidase inhibitor family I36 protein [Longispora sp. NPDC051575]|uniref:peptidase inhibitor family I36 protein n=1 Tax=Longispora sp. NPDC051575 TaxID=3154943 RepID=UPI00342746AC